MVVVELDVLVVVVMGVTGGNVGVRGPTGCQSADVKAPTSKPMRWVPSTSIVMSRSNPSMSM